MERRWLSDPPGFSRDGIRDMGYPVECNVKKHQLWIIIVYAGAAVLRLLLFLL